MGGAKPFRLGVRLNVFVEREEKYLESSLSLEHVQNLEVLFVESSLDLVLVVCELSQLLLVRLAHQSNEESSGNSVQ